MSLRRLTTPLLIIVSGILLLLFGKTSFQVNDGESPFLNLRDSVRYVGMATCRSCHSNIHDTYIHTGMGRSFDLATKAKSGAQFGNHAVVYDTLRDFFYYPFFKDSTMYVLEYRLEKGDTVHRRLEQISYIVGSGQHTNSHLINENGYLYQAPVTWYAQLKKWDLAPGFRENNSRFSRALAEECVTCHNNYPEMVPGSLNKYAAMPGGIECERCHGPGGLHVREKLAGNIVDTSTSADYTIVNPRRLPRDLQMDLCQRCHLQGIAVTEEGKSFFDFKPGMKLNSVLNVFLPRFTDTHEKFIMASQADRLRMSECFKNSRALSCLTCHNPHKSVEATSATHFNNACKGCHNSQNTCAAPPADRQEKPDDCTSCHMPRSGSTDIPHVRITDHRIAVHGPVAAKQRVNAPAFLGIEILTKENPTALDMAKGYLATFDKYVASPVMLDSAAYYLDRANEPFDRKFPALVHYFFLRNDYDGILAALSKLPENKAVDAWTAYRVGEAFFRKDNFEQALFYFNKAVAAMPYQLDFLEKKGMALISLERWEEAKMTLENVLAENPKRPVALCNLGYVHVLTGKLELGEKRYDQAIALEPDYEQALLNKAALLIFLKRRAEARKLLGRVLSINPANQQALGALEMVNEGI